MSGDNKSQETKTPESTKHKSKKKFVVKTVKYLQTNCNHDEVFNYIDGLHHYVKKQQRKLMKYKEKLKKSTKKIRNLKHLNKKHESSSPAKNEEVNPASATKTFSDQQMQPMQTTEDMQPTKTLSLAEEIREAAEAAQNETGFVYEPTSGLYYDRRTGYYYNAEYSLYYDALTGCYYKYNQDTNKFEFHSQVEMSSTSEDAKAYDKHVINRLLDNFSNLKLTGCAVSHQVATVESIKDENAISSFTLQAIVEENQDEEDSKDVENEKESRKQAKKRRRLERAKKKALETKSNDDKELEDGELNSISSPSGSDRSSVEELKENGLYQDIARKYPPSLRLIVQETNLEKLQAGTLKLITFKGGTLGREGDRDVIIPDVNVSKFHLKFAYDETREVYTCVDLGSRNGTILNGKRMSSSQQESECLDLVHGSVIQLSQTKLLCHVHPGNSTCGLCEPGLLIDTKEETSKTVPLSHKQQLKKLQQKYGLENEKFIENLNVPGYNDRAATRRIQFGSSTDQEKTEMASVNTEISSENKGFKMLSKLGWNKGETLGKTDSGGLLEPISMNSNEGFKGLGCNDNNVSSLPLTKKNKKKMLALQKTQERYNKVSETNVLKKGDDNELLS